MDIKYLYNPNNTNIDNIEIPLHTDLNRTTFFLLYKHNILIKR